MIASDRHLQENTSNAKLDYVKKWYDSAQQNSLFFQKMEFMERGRKKQNKRGQVRNSFIEIYCNLSTFPDSF